MIDTTTGSSAAPGLLAAPDTFSLGSANTDGTSALNQLASEFRRLSPVASFANGRLRGVEESQISPEKIKTVASAAEQGLGRLVDGAYIDNTSVAYAIREMQTSSGTKAPFEVTLMMNSTLDPLTGMATMPGGTKVDGAVAVLFGRDYKGNPLSNGVAVPFEELGFLRPPMPSAQVFDISAWNTVAGPTWSYAADNATFSIQYYALNVTTVTNPVLGITGGQAGKLHLIATNNSQSYWVPIMPSHLDEYDQNFTYTRDAMIRAGGWEALRSAFGA